MSDEKIADEKPEDQGDVAAMSEIYRRLTSEPVEEEPAAEAAEAKEPDPAPKAEAKAEAAPEAAPEPDRAEAPSDLPAAIRAKWAALDDETRSAFASTHREMGRKLAEQGRLVQGVKPVVDVLQQAIQQLPSLKDMRPEDVARDVFKTAQISDQLRRDPVNTLLGIAKQAGALDGLKQALSGERPNEAAQEKMQLMQEIRALKEQISQQSRAVDPAAMTQHIDTVIRQRDTLNFVQQFAAEKENWQTVEPYIPAMIPLAQQTLGESASPKDVLSQAYDMAIHAHPELRAKLQAAAPAPAQTDPQVTASARKAKSVNITGKPTSKPQLSERDAMAEVYRKYASGG
jgi:hypothetical protein